MEIHDRDRTGLQHAIEQARIGRSEGGVPIGGALVADDGTVLAVGHNRRVQQGSAIRHGETDALENGGRLPASVYRRSTMYTTLSPCDMCTGAILLYGIPRVVIGENRTFVGGEDYLRARGVEVVNLDSEECVDADGRVHRRPPRDLERGHRRGLGGLPRPHDVVDGSRAAEALERQGLHLLGLELILNRGEQPVADEDLAPRCCLAQARGEDHDVAHCPVVVSALEADPAEGRESDGDPDPQAQVVAAPMPAFGEGGEPHPAWRAPRGWRRSWWSGLGTGSLKKTISPSPAKCSTVPPWATTSSPTMPWYSRSTPSTSSGSAVSAKAVNPRRSQNSAVISRRCPVRSDLPSSLDSMLATCGAKRASSVRCRSTVSNSRAFSIARVAWSANVLTSAISRSLNARTSLSPEAE